MSAISGFCEKCNKVRKGRVVPGRYCDGNRNTCMSILLDTIEALQAENEQLQAQVAQVREALRKASAGDRASWFECDRCANMRDALTAIDKAIGGKEDGK